MFQNPEHIANKAKEIVLDLLPVKSRAIYQKEYDVFNEWKDKNGVFVVNEDVLLNYFHEKSQTFKPSSIWSKYSMLRAVLSVKEDIYIDKFPKLIAFLKRNSVGYEPKKSKVLSIKEIGDFLATASDETYLLTKIDDSERSNVTEDFLRVIEVNRHVHYWYILIISVIAAIGNILVIRSVSIRKYKYLQKTCMISLALSDLLTVILFAMNYLDLLGKELITWSFGEFMCHALPVGQVVGNLASSIALVVIALDRYHSIIYALSKKWNPSWWKCLVGAVVLWIICIGISYPMATFYFHIPLRIPSGDVYLCTGTTVSRDWIKAYYVIINMLFFCPVLSMFFWFYFKIAVIVWRHRKPISDKMAERADDSENISCSKISTDAPIKVIARPTPKRKNVHMERKKRTFKIVIILIFAFIGCRMPYWLFWVYKMYFVSRGNTIWTLTLIFTGLNLLNCAMNPFLYAYLNQTLYAIKKLKEFVCKICCCCFTNAEFEDFETGKPVVEGVMGYNNRCATIEQRLGYSEKFPQAPNFQKCTLTEKF